MRVLVAGFANAGEASAFAGFVADAAERRWTLLQSDGAGVDAFERAASTLLEHAHGGGFDAVYIDLHDVVIAEHADDPAGALLERLRAVVGRGVPVVASLDLQADIGERLLRVASALTVGRTWPPTDAWETGARAAGLLAEVAARGAYVTRWRRLPFAVPATARSTRDDPAAGLMADLQTLQCQSGVHLGIAFGSPGAAAPQRGPVVFGHGRDAEVVEAEVEAAAENAVQLRG